MKHLMLFVSWLSISTITLLVSLTTIQFLREPRSLVYSEPGNGLGTQPVLTFRQFKDYISHRSVLGVDDARPVLISKFLETYNSPLKPYDHFGNFFVHLADKYQIDYRLLPAISMQESNLCKAIPEGSFNCLGLGVHSQGTWMFESYEANFEAAAKILKENYIDQGLITPDQIQTKYTPSSNGSWQFAVNQFMTQIDQGKF